MTITKNTHGGSRPGSGQPRKEETTTISIRLPKKLKEELMKAYRGTLNKKILEFLKSIKPETK